MSAQYDNPVIPEDDAGTVDVVTEFRREAALLKTGALQNAIFNSANFSSIATDEKGVIQLFNVGAERMLGYTAIEVVDKITPADISDPQEVVISPNPFGASFRPRPSLAGEGACLSALNSSLRQAPCKAGPRSTTR